MIRKNYIQIHIFTIDTLITSTIFRINMIYFIIDKEWVCFQMRYYTFPYIQILWCCLLIMQCWHCLYCIYIIYNMHIWRQITIIISYCWWMDVWCTLYVIIDMWFYGVNFAILCLFFIEDFLRCFIMVNVVMYNLFDSRKLIYIW